MGVGEVMPQKRYLHPITGEPLDEIKTYLDENGERIDNSKANSDNYKGPDTFLEGFEESPEVQAMLKGGKGFLKGAILDLPSSLLSGALQTGKHILNMPFHPIDTTMDILDESINLAGNVADKFSKAGGESEEFGRMMGQITGQPLATAGITKGAPSIVRGSGVPVEYTGNIMKRFQPVSGFLPRLIEGRTLRNIEKGIGRRVENIGKGMRKMGKTSPILEGEVVNPIDDTIPYSEVNEVKQLPSSRTSFYNDAEYKNPIITPSPADMKQLPPSNVSFYMNQSETPLPIESSTPLKLFSNKSGKSKLPPIGSQPSLGPIELPSTLTIKELHPNLLKQLINDGYKFEGQNADKSFNFRLTKR